VPGAGDIAVPGAGDIAVPAAGDIAVPAAGDIAVPAAGAVARSARLAAVRSAASPGRVMASSLPFVAGDASPWPGTGREGRRACMNGDIEFLPRSATVRRAALAGTTTCRRLSAEPSHERHAGDQLGQKPRRTG
jgi:hypothetical protein